MIILNDRYRIVRYDEHNLQIQEYREIVSKKDKSVRKDWVNIGYYGNLKHALLGILNKYIFNLMDNDILDIKTLLDKLNEIENDINNLGKKK